MRYEIPKKDKKAFLDDSLVKETLNIIERLTGKNIDVEIINQVELFDFINNPKNFLNDEDLIREIEDLREIIIEMSDVYNV